MTLISEYSRSDSKGNINYQTTQMAKIKSTEDDSHSGRVKVWLMSSNTDENDEANWVTVRYASPFAGVSNPNKVDSQATETSGQTSYGFFAVPPDTENVVLVDFANGEPDKGFWRGGTFADQMTHMIPGRAAAQTHAGGGKPAMEVNRYSQQTSAPGTNPTRPQLEGNATSLTEQGLENDELLGAGNSTVWRDKTPSVMGWSSPGGNQFIMDDGDGYSLIRLRTASGVQLLLSESTGDIFAGNKSGNGWLRLRNDGNVDIYSSVSYNVFGGSDINFKSGGNINMEAAGTINIKGANVKIDGSGSVSLKAPPWSVFSSQITAEIKYAEQAVQSENSGPAIPLGDMGQAADPVGKTPGRGGVTS